MSKHSFHPSSNESQDNTSDFQKILEELRVMKINTDVQFAIMAEEIKTLKKKDHKYKSKASSSKKYSSSEDERPERDSLRANEHYQPVPYHHHKRDRKSKEIRVDLPHFHGTNDRYIFRLGNEGGTIV